MVSTHSRLKAAGGESLQYGVFQDVSTHSRLKAAGCCICCSSLSVNVSTHSRLKAAGAAAAADGIADIGFNTQPPKGGWRTNRHDVNDDVLFQHTAA